MAHRCAAGGSHVAGRYSRGQDHREPGNTDGLPQEDAARPTSLPGTNKLDITCPSQADKSWLFELAYVRTPSGYEVDFVAPSGLVQACASIDDPSTRDREIRALREAMASLG